MRCFAPIPIKKRYRIGEFTRHNVLLFPFFFFDVLPAANRDLWIGCIARCCMVEVDASIIIHAASLMRHFGDAYCEELLNEMLDWVPGSAKALHAVSNSCSSWRRASRNLKQWAAAAFTSEDGSFLHLHPEATLITAEKTKLSLVAICHACQHYTRIASVVCGACELRGTEMAARFASSSLQRVELDCDADDSVSMDFSPCSALREVVLRKFTVSRLVLSDGVEQLSLMRCHGTTRPVNATCRALRVLKLEYLFQPCGWDELAPGLLPALEVLELSVVFRLECKQLLAEVRNTLRTLNVSGASIQNADIVPLASAPLEEVTLSSCHSLTSVACLTTCTGLKTLYVANCTLDDIGIEGVERFSRLETLRLICCSVTSLNRAKTLRTLRFLEVSVTSLVGRGLVDLQDALPALEELNLRQGAYSGTTDDPEAFAQTVAGFVRHCRSLRVLVLTRSYVGDEAVRDVGSLAQLECLDLSECSICTIAPFLSCSALKRLLLSGNQLSTIEGVERLQQLEELEVANTDIRSVQNLRGCRHLKRLNASFTNVDDEGIRGLESCSMLEDLDFHYCTGITNVSALQNCRLIRKLNLDRTHVTQLGIAGLETLEFLEELDVSRNPNNLNVEAISERCTRLSSLLTDLMKDSCDDPDEY